jgi:hypothetical protein
MAGAASPEKQLSGFIDKYSPAIARQLRDVLSRMRKRLPGATILVYDNYNALAVGFATGDRVKNVVFSIAAFPRWISLFLFGGTDFDDPRKLLKGSGKTVRHIVLETPEMLDDPAVKALMAQALKRHPVPMPKSPPGKLVIQSISPKQRPRRPAT